MLLMLLFGATRIPSAVVGTMVVTDALGLPEPLLLLRYPTTASASYQAPAQSSCFPATRDRRPACHWDRKFAHRAGSSSTNPSSSNRRRRCRHPSAGCYGQ